MSFSNGTMTFWEEHEVAAVILEPVVGNSGHWQIMVATFVNVLKLFTLASISTLLT